ncbi:MAG: hypothetical protein HYZ37_09450 [Candidatus Solibacter usitatus]|nr:hypothetical protein [Candidatus Solibacter usitatus]
MYSLPQELKHYAEEQTKNGYITRSEYFRELIRADQRRRTKDKLDAMLLEGMRSGDSIPVDAKFWRILTLVSCVAALVQAIRLFYIDRKSNLDYAP